MTDYDRWALASPPESRFDDDLEALTAVFDAKVKEIEAAGIAFTGGELWLAYAKATDRLAVRGEDSVEQVVEDVLEGYGREVDNAAKTN